MPARRARYTVGVGGRRRAARSRDSVWNPPVGCSPTPGAGLVAGPVAASGTNGGTGPGATVSFGRVPSDCAENADSRAGGTSEAYGSGT